MWLSRTQHEALQAVGMNTVSSVYWWGLSVVGLFTAQQLYTMHTAVSQIISPGLSCSMKACTDASISGLSRRNVYLVVSKQVLFRVCVN